jgi:macrolide-specific efflux system membrane fusion protein
MILFKYNIEMKFSITKEINLMKDFKDGAKKRLRLLAWTAGLSIALTGCSILPAEETFPAAPVLRTYEAEEYKMATVMRGDLAETKKVTCSYKPAKQETLGFGVSGKEIKGIYVASGEVVKAGQLLAELEHEALAEQMEDLEYQISVLHTKNEYAMKSWDVEIQILDLKYEKDSDSHAAKKAVIDAKYILELEANNDALHIKELRLQELQEEIRLYKIYAGMDGTVTYVRSVQEGDRSEEDRSMVTIADMETTAFVVKGKDAELFSIGDEVTILLNKSEAAAICVEASALGISEETGKDVYFQLLQPDPTLESGNSGTIQVVLDSRENVLYVNKNVIKTTQDKHFVYVLSEEGLRESRDVTVGKVFGDVIEILNGLKEGESVILN